MATDIEEMLVEKEKDTIVDSEGNILPSESEEKPQEEADASSEQHDESAEDLEEGDDTTSEESQDDAELRRERNRQRRMENKQRRKEYIESLRREIAARDELLQQAMSRLDAVERRAQGADLAMVDTELKKTIDAYNYFKVQHAEAVSAADGQRAVEAQEKMLQASERAKQLQSIRQALTKTQQAPQPLDPRIRVLAESWRERNPWYDPNVGDTDSRIALTVDQALAAEGWNPATEQYWNELDSRLKKYLPHRYNLSYNTGNRVKTPVAGSGKESVNSSSGYRLSAERVQALKDAGIWDDPKARAEAIKRYQEYDKQQGAR